MKMNINSKDFRVPARKKLNHKKWPTVVKPVCMSKKEYSTLLQKQVEELSALQRFLYASNRDAMLLTFRRRTLQARTAPTRQRVRHNTVPSSTSSSTTGHPSSN